MAVQIQHRNDTAANWTAADPVLAQGEMGIENDTDLFKIGNGVDVWSDLAYGGLQGPAGVETASSPLVLNSETKDISLDYTALVIDGGTA